MNLSLFQGLKNQVVLFFFESSRGQQISTLTQQSNQNKVADDAEDGTDPKASAFQVPCRCYASALQVRCKCYASAIYGSAI